jgi:ribosome-binding protein aMBF1 (putative translation factor)
MNWKQVKKEMLSKPAVRREYEALEEDYELARSIIEQRIARRLSQRQLAQRVGTKQPVISRLESGHARPSLSLLKRVAKALDATLVVRLESRSQGGATARGRRAAS